MAGFASGGLGQSVSWPMQYLRAAPIDAQACVAVSLEKLKSCFEEQHAIPEKANLPAVKWHVF